MIKKSPLAAVAIVLVVLGNGAVVAAEPTLKEIMQGLRDSLVAMTDGLLLEQPEVVARAATEIAEHAPISAAERSVIKTTLGTDMPGFAQFDQRVHALSLAIRDAASQGALQRAERDYQQMLAACFACHTAYKARVGDALATSTEAR